MSRKLTKEEKLRKEVVRVKRQMGWTELALASIRLREKFEKKRIEKKFSKRMRPIIAKFNKLRRMLEMLQEKCPNYREHGTKTQCPVCLDIVCKEDDGTRAHY